MYVNKLNDIVNKFNDTYYSTIKAKSVCLKTSVYIESSKEINFQDTKFRIGDIARISKHKNIFAKSYVPNWYEEVFVIKKVKNIVLWTYVIRDLKGKKIVGKLNEKNCKQKFFRSGKVI